MAIVRGRHQVSSHPDGNGNYRATNPNHPRFVGYGKTPTETDENLTRAIHEGKLANPLAQLEAMFMTLSEADQARFLEDLPKLRRSYGGAAVSTGLKDRTIRAASRPTGTAGSLRSERTASGPL